MFLSSDTPLRQSHLAKCLLHLSDSHPNFRFLFCPPFTAVRAEWCHKTAQTLHVHCLLLKTTDVISNSLSSDSLSFANYR